MHWPMLAPISRGTNSTASMRFCAMKDRVMTPRWQCSPMPWRWNYSNANSAKGICLRSKLAEPRKPSIDLLQSLMSPEQSLYERLGGHVGILKLIKPFYADVRQHNILGPIFNSHITD